MFGNVTILSVFYNFVNNLYYLESTLLNTYIVYIFSHYNLKYTCKRLVWKMFSKSKLSNKYENGRATPIGFTFTDLWPLTRSQRKQQQTTFLRFCRVVKSLNRKWRMIRIKATKTAQSNPKQITSSWMIITFTVIRVNLDTVQLWTWNDKNIKHSVLLGSFQ